MENKNQPLINKIKLTQNNNGKCNLQITRMKTANMYLFYHNKKKSPNKKPSSSNWHIKESY